MQMQIESKKNTKKLRLNRETLRALEPKELKDVLGGMPCRTSGVGTSTPSECYC